MVDVAPYTMSKENCMCIVGRFLIVILTVLKNKIPRFIRYNRQHLLISC